MGAWRLALSYHCGDRPRACGRRERQKARTQIGTEQNATALPSRTLPKSAARSSPPKEREFLRTWSPSIAEVCYRRRGPAAAPMNADAEPPAGLAVPPIIGCLLPSCLACRRSLLTGPIAAAQPFAGNRLHAPMRPFTVVAAEARSHAQRNADLTSRASSRIASRSAA